MASEIEYALMAGRAYQENRADINRFPVLSGWLPRRHEYDGAAGFEAISFINGTDIANSTEIVIAYTGTDELVDWFANGGLAFGFATDQIKQAALYYLQVREINPGATISFTGHSLGGGLAALMGVLFDERAVTFDQAPFANSASTSVRDAIVAYLNEQGYSNTRLTELVPELLTYGGSVRRSDHVAGACVLGESQSAQDGARLLNIAGSACSKVRAHRINEVFWGGRRYDRKEIERNDLGTHRFGCFVDGVPIAGSFFRWRSVSGKQGVRYHGPPCHAQAIRRNTPDAGCSCFCRADPMRVLEFRGDLGALRGDWSGCPRLQT